MLAGPADDGLGTVGGMFRCPRFAVKLRDKARTSVTRRDQGTSSVNGAPL